MGTPNFEDFPDMKDGMGPPEGKADVTEEFLTSEGSNPMAIQSATVSLHETEQAPESTPQEGTEQKGFSPNFKRRLDKLVRQRQEAREDRDLASAERDMYKRRVEQLEAQLQSNDSRFRASPTQYTVPGTEGHESFLAGDTGQGGGGQFGRDTDIREIIRQEMQPLVEHVSQSRRAEQQRSQAEAEATKLQNEQLQSLQEASEEFPQLAQPNSDLYQLTDRLLKSVPALAHSPNGPYEAALMARGLLAEEARSEEVTTQKKKTAVAINRPAEGSTPSAPKGDLVGQYQGGLRSLLQNSDFSAWKKARRAQIQATGSFMGEDVGGVFPER